VWVGCSINLFEHVVEAVAKRSRHARDLLHGRLVVDEERVDEVARRHKVFAHHGPHAFALAVAPRPSPLRKPQVPVVVRVHRWSLSAGGVIHLLCVAKSVKVKLSPAFLSIIFDGREILTPLSIRMDAAILPLEAARKAIAGATQLKSAKETTKARIV